MTEFTERRCSMCRKGRHLACSGLGCACRGSDRCAANALLTLEREKRDPRDAA